jgi:hypothetical protein
MTTPLCSATWPNGCCDRAPGPSHGGLCPTHYQQQRRGRPFAPIRGPAGADPRALVSVTFHVPADDGAAMADEAARRGVPVSEVYREAVSAYLLTLHG